MPGMNYVLRSISESVESIFGSPDAHRQNHPQRYEDDQLDTDFESPHSMKKENIINRYRTLKDLEEGSWNSDADEPAANVKLDSKLYARYLLTLLTMTCGFVASIFSFIDGLIFILQCPENWILPCLLMLLGILGTFALLYIILKLLENDFDGFGGLEKVIIHTSFVILVFQWFMGISILYLQDERYNSTDIVYCNPKFYGYAKFTNVIAALAFLFHYFLQYIHRKRID